MGMAKRVAGARGEEPFMCGIAGVLDLAEWRPEGCQGQRGVGRLGG